MLQGNASSFRSPYKAGFLGLCGNAARAARLEGGIACDDADSETSLI